MSLSDEYRSEGAGRPNQPEVEEPSECPVCMDDIHSAVETNCGHIFCGGYYFYVTKIILFNAKNNLFCGKNYIFYCQK